MISLSHLPWRSMRPSLSLDAEEKLMSAFSTHWVKYVTPTLCGVLFAAVGIAVLWFSSFYAAKGSVLQLATFFMGVLILVSVIHWFFRRILSESMEDVIITNKRFIYLKTRLWSADDMHEISLDQVKAVEARMHGIVQNALDFGSLWFDTGGTGTQDRTIFLVPKPHTQANILAEILRKR